jgi:peptidoglycan/xylan/chitin deacetylase (PgdA/CDA1 family)
MMKLRAPSALRRRSREERGQAVILMYHSISRGRPDPWELCVDPDHFAEQAQLICDRYHAVSLGELRGALERGERLTRAVALTFDDGYRDNLLVAKPILEQHGLPATVFVTTGYVGSERDFWWEELEAFCASAGQASRAVWEELQALSHERRAARLDELWASIDARPPAASLPLTPAGLERLAEDGLVRLGAHTVTHPHLSSLSAQEQRVEILASKEYLSEVAGRTVEDFSYPHGDFSQETIALVESAGFETACTTLSRPVTRGARPLELPRVQVGNWNAEALERELDRRLA